LTRDKDKHKESDIIDMICWREREGGGMERESKYHCCFSIEKGFIYTFII